MSRPKADPVEDTLRRLFALTEQQQKEFDRCRRIIVEGKNAMDGQPEPPKRKAKAKREPQSDLQETH